MWDLQFYKLNIFVSNKEKYVYSYCSERDIDKVIKQYLIQGWR